MQYEIREIELDDELSHHGIMGQKWGIRRFQFKDGSLTEEGRKRYGQLKSTVSKWKVRMKEQSEANKKAKEEAAEVKKQKQLEKQKAKEESAEKEKQHLIEYGTPEQIKQNIRLFDSYELSRIEKRFATELSINDKIEKLTASDKVNQSVKQIKLVEKPKKANSFDKIKNATKFVSDIATNTNTATINAKNVYNNIAKIHNTFRPGSTAWNIIPN